MIWDKILANGLEKKDNLDLIAKYPRPQNFAFLKIPKLNEELVLVLSNEAKKDPPSQSALKWDKNLSEIQSYLSAATAGLGQIINIILSKEDMPQRDNLITHAGNVGQILTNCHYVASLYRRSAIYPCISRQAREVAMSNQVDDYLLGKDFNE